jgi:sucrose-6-phosphate hydrolase SacC (GH32 family)
MTLQYYKPQGPYFVGDCMPFYHDGLFRLYYLLDEQHHAARDGLGGHQWAQAASTDLVHWQHHPLAIPITEEREGSICTGSVFFHDGAYYGFYATRLRDYTQHLSLATSRDAVHFEKTQPNPFASPPPGYNPLDYRDPVVFQEAGTGLFHLLVTASLTDWQLGGRGGCLAHLVSRDLHQWELCDPLVIPGLPGAPECPDYFEWNGWYYLIFSNLGITYYRLSRAPLGPWLRPPVDTLDGPAARVMKTAAFGPDRRIGVAWLGTRQGDVDDGQFQFGGNMIFRELIQHADGTLGAKFVPEVALAGAPLSTFEVVPLAGQTQVAGRTIHLAAPQGQAATNCLGLPRNVHLKLRIQPQPGAFGFGLRFGGEANFESGYHLHFAPHAQVVTLQQQRLEAVTGLERPFTLEVVLWDDIIDVCIAGRRTLLDRCPQRRGSQVMVYAEDAEVTFELDELTALA